MACKPMSDVTLPMQSKKTLKEIAKRIKLGKYLEPLMVGGTLFNALANNKAIPVIFSVQVTDWAALAQALKSVGSFTKRAVQTEIKLMILNTRGKENKFWKNMYECF